MPPDKKEIAMASPCQNNAKTDAASAVKAWVFATPKNCCCQSPEGCCCCVSDKLKAYLFNNE